MSELGTTPDEVDVALPSGIAADSGGVDESGIVVEVVDDRPVEDQVEPRDESRNDGKDNDFDKELSEEEVSAMGGRASKKIKRLQYEYHEERRAKEASARLREEAITCAQEREREAEHLRGLLRHGQDVLLSEVRSRTEADLGSARTLHRNAIEAGDPDEILKTQENMNQAQIAKFQADNYSTVEESPKQQATPSQGWQPTQAQQQLPNPAIQSQQPPGAAVAPVVNGQRDPKLESWLGNNVWFGKDNEMTQLAMGIHENLTKNHGISPYSDEYYNRVDSRLRELVPKFFGASEDKGEVVPVSTRTPSVVATPSRTGSGSPKTVKLTTSAIAIAERLGLTREQYASQVLKDRKANV